MANSIFFLKKNAICEIHLEQLRLQKGVLDNKNMQDNILECS